MSSRFIGNGADRMGENVPPDELNRAPEPGLNFGFPYCRAGTISDAEFGAGVPSLQGFRVRCSHPPRR